MILYEEKRFWVLLNKNCLIKLSGVLMLSKAAFTKSTKTTTKGGDTNVITSVAFSQ